MMEKPEDIMAIKAELASERAALALVLAELAALKELSAYQALEIAKLKHQLYGRSSERSSTIIGQLELELGSAIATATTADLVAEEAVLSTGKGIHPARATAWLRALVSSSRVRVLGGVKLAMRACVQAGVRARFGDRCY